MPAEILDSLGVSEKITSRLREDDLAPVRRCHDPRRPVYVHADVPRSVQNRLSRMDADPYSNRAGRLELRGRRASGSHRLARSREGVEEGVALIVDLVSVEAAERITNDPMMRR